VTSRVRVPCTFHLCSLSLRSQSRFRLEGRTRTLSGPSPDLSQARTLASSWSRVASAIPLRCGDLIDDKVAVVLHLYDGGAVSGGVC